MGVWRWGGGARRRGLQCRFTEGTAMAKAIVDPAELRRFAMDFKRFNNELETQLTGLHSRMVALGQSWRDQEYMKFMEDFESHMKLLGRSIESANQHIPFLMRKAERIEDYLRQR